MNDSANMDFVMKEAFYGQGKEESKKKNKKKSLSVNYYTADNAAKQKPRL